jgi:hypothetical protein
MSLTVDAEMRRLLVEAEAASGERTASKAIRWALQKALTPIPSVTLGLKIIHWAEGLVFATEKDKRELRSLVREMYELLK